MDKDLQYYIDHPEETPDDPAVLAQLAEQMAAPVVTDPAAEPEDKDVKKEEPAPSAAAPEEKPAQEQEEEGVIATPSGKGTIPYAVLKGEREKRQAAEAAVAELNAKVQQIEQQMAKGTDKGDAAAAKELEALSAEELEAIRTDFPVFGNVIDKLLTKIGTLTDEITTIKQGEQAREATARTETAKTVQELIDGDPVLLHLQTTDPDLFAKAVEIDRALMGNPRYSDMATRFAKVSEVMESTFGPFEGVKHPAPPPSTIEVDKDVARGSVEKQVAASKASPKSLSDIPAGDPPASSELDNLENLSAVELSDRMMKMSPDQRTAFLNRF